MNDCHELTEVLAVLVAGHRKDRLGGDVSLPLEARLESVIYATEVLSKERLAALRIITGVAEGTDVAATAIAERLNLPLHLIAPGLPQALTLTQQRAERVVWLGAPDVGAHGDEAYAVRDEVALCFADLLVVVWDGESPHGLAGGTVRLVFQAALMMSPVVWIGTDGSVRTLDRYKLDEACLHKLRSVSSTLRNKAQVELRSRWRRNKWRALRRSRQQPQSRSTSQRNIRASNNANGL